jgi:hypothetical protein
MEHKLQPQTQDCEMPDILSVPRRHIHMANSHLYGKFQMWCFWIPNISQNQNI